MNSNSNSNNASQNNDLLFNAKIPISESEDDKTQYNQEPNYNQNQINKHLIYKKGAKKLSIPKKNLKMAQFQNQLFWKKITKVIQIDYY